MKTLFTAFLLSLTVVASGASAEVCLGTYENVPDYSASHRYKVVCDGETPDEYIRKFTVVVVVPLFWNWGMDKLIAKTETRMQELGFQANGSLPDFRYDQEDKFMFFTDESETYETFCIGRSQNLTTIQKELPHYKFTVACTDGTEMTLDTTGKADFLEQMGPEFDLIEGLQERYDTFVLAK